MDSDKVIGWLQVVSTLVRLGKVTYDEIRVAIHESAGSDADTYELDNQMLAQLHNEIAAAKDELERS